jgi:hypothetical protein
MKEVISISGSWVQIPVFYVILTIRESLGREVGDTKKKFKGLKLRFKASAMKDLQKVKGKILPVRIHTE